MERRGAAGELTEPTEPSLLSGLGAAHMPVDDGSEHQRCKITIKVRPFPGLLRMCNFDSCYRASRDHRTGVLVNEAEDRGQN